MPRQVAKTAMLLIALLLSGVSARAQVTPEDHAATRQLIAAVNDNVDPSRTGPYAMAVKIAFNPGKRDQQIGELRFYRDTGRFRSDLRLGNYNEIHVRDGNKHYVARSQPFPVPGTDTFSFPDRLWTIKIPPRAKLSDLTDKKLGDAEAQCFSAKDPRYHAAETRYCVDAQSKVLLERSTSFETVRLSAYASVGGGRLPTSILVVDSGDLKRRVELHDAQISQIVPQAETFAAPEHAREFEICDYIQGTDFINRVEPVYPPDLGPQSWLTATMFVHGVIDKDGRYTDVHVFSPEGAAFEKAGRDAAAQWRFTPGTCDGHAVAAEQDVIITMSRHR